MQFDPVTPPPIVAQLATPKPRPQPHVAWVRYFIPQSHTPREWLRVASLGILAAWIAAGALLAGYLIVSVMFDPDVIAIARTHGRGYYVLAVLVSGLYALACPSAIFAPALFCTTMGYLLSRK